MHTITTFDVLVVYSEKLAISAKASASTSALPFKIGSESESYNLVYSYFLQTCQKNGLSTALSTSADITDAGEVESYWTSQKNVWHKTPGFAYSRMIFDKFSPTTKQICKKRNLMFSSKKVRSFNNPYLFNLCFDKQKTYDRLGKFSIPTESITGHSQTTVAQACTRLSKKIARHAHKEDFSEDLILKDRFGAGGRRIFKINAGDAQEITAIVKANKHTSFVIQPFVKFDQGFFINNTKAPTDIRLIFLGNKIIQTYTRVAKKGDYRCNEHKGGLLSYIPKRGVPAKVVSAANKIALEINKKTSLFALDFIISNNGHVYLLEANTGPGLDWNLAIKENELASKKLMRKIIQEIVRRVKKPKNTVSKKTRLDYPTLPNLVSLT